MNSEKFHSRRDQRNQWDRRDRREKEKLSLMVKRIGERAVQITDDDVRDASLQAMLDLCNRYTAPASEEHMELWERLMEVFLAGKYAGRQDLNWRIEQLRKQAGKAGGTSRHSKTTQLKSWALRLAQSERGSAKQISRKLVSKIPADLQYASIDPERLIYEALLSLLKTNDKPAVPADDLAVPARKPAE
jgi:hypothetical protein